ncbi:MAG: O-antigen ligase family protein [Candidatus Omnitrophica bacterium]|nr:O-antigen ligase family protein [Candidatus Omnitrophota bacterium]
MSNKNIGPIVFMVSLCLIIVYAPLVRGAVRIWSFAPIALFITALTMLWAWQMNNNGNPRPLYKGKDRAGMLFGVFIVLAALSCVFSINRHDSFFTLLGLMAYGATYWMVVYYYGRVLRRAVIGAVIAAGTVLSLYGLLQYFDIFPHSWWIPENFLAATFVNHNHFAGFLELVLPVAIAGIIYYGKDRLSARLLMAGPVIVMAAAFLFTQSRGAWLSLAATLFVMALALIARRRFRKEGTVLLIAMLVFIMGSLYLTKGAVSQRIDTLSNIGSGETSWSMREMIWRGTVRMIADNSLTGTGIGTYYRAYPRYRVDNVRARVYFAHNDYLHMAAEMGIAALVVLLAMIAVIVFEGVACNDLIIFGCAMGCLSLALHGLVDFNFHIPANMLLFVVYAAMIAGESRKEGHVTRKG